MNSNAPRQLWHWVGLVNVFTRLQPGWWIGLNPLTGARCFSVLHNIETDSVVHPVSCPVCTTAFSLGANMITHHHLVPRLRMHRKYSGDTSLDSHLGRRLPALNEVWGFCGSGYKDYYSLRYENIYSGRNLPTFWRNMQHISSEHQQVSIT
jgi:hypothetical protein